MPCLCSALVFWALADDFIKYPEGGEKIKDNYKFINT